MEIPELHRLRREDFDAVIQTLTECFFEDPLYQALIPERAQRREILPEVFDCDANELVQYCDMYADSPAVNGLIMLEDPAEHKGVRKYLAERYFAYLTEQRLLEDDESGEIAEHFRKAKNFLSSDWVAKAGKNTIHIVYFAVRKAFHGKGLAHRLITPVLDYADKNGVQIALETHNAANLDMYKHYGFELFDSFTGSLNLREYCLLRKPAAGGAAER